MHVRAATRDDLPQMASISAAAFAEDELFQFLNPRLSQWPEHFVNSFLQRLRMRFVEKGIQGIVCVSDEKDTFLEHTQNCGQFEEEVLGFAWWARDPPCGSSALPAPAEWANKNNNIFAALERTLLSIEQNYTHFFSLNRCSDPQRINQFRSAMVELDPFVPLKDHLHLHFIAVSPSYQRKNIGGQLVDWGLEHAKREGVPATLTASPVGLGLYRKRGFKVMNALDVGGMFDPAMVFDPEEKWTRNLTSADDEIIKFGMKMEAVWNEKAKAMLTDAERQKLPGAM